MSPASVGEQEGAVAIAEAQGEPTIEGPSSEGLRSGDVGLSATEARGEFPAGELPPREVGGAGERIETSVEPVGKEQTLVIEEETSDEGGGHDEDLPAKASLADTSGILAPGLVEVSKESQARILLREARRLEASRLEVARASPSDGQSNSLDPIIEAAFAALVRSALYPSAGPSVNEFADLDLIDAAFGRQNVAKDVHLLPEIGNSALMELARSYASRNALITRALRWRLNLATGAGVQAKKVSTELRLRAEASDKLERVMDIANENLARARGLHQAALNDASRLRLEVKELRELRARYDEACLELSRIISRHAGEMETVKK